MGDLIMYRVRCPDGKWRHGYYKYTSSDHNHAMIDARDYTASASICNHNRRTTDVCPGGVHIVEVISYPEEGASELYYEW